jgi:ribose 5-phosphate isomerase RpiB
MSLATVDIDRIVAEVVRRLRSHAAPSSTVPASTVPVSTVSASNAAGELVLTDKVITLSLLKGKLTGVSKLTVGERAIVTPAVRDELKQRGIVWSRSSSQRSGTTSIGLLTAATDEASATALKVIRCPRIERIETGASMSLENTAKDLARHMTARQIPGLLVSNRPYAALVAASQAQGIRAAIVKTTADVEQAAAEAAVNLFVVSPLQTTPTVLKNIAQAIATAAAAQRKARS